MSSGVKLYENCHDSLGGCPYVKSGGLGDVMLGLPNELARIPDNEVCLFLPYYKRVKENPAYETELCAEFRVGLSWREQYAGLHKLKAQEAAHGVFHRQ